MFSSSWISMGSSFKNKSDIQYTERLHELHNDLQFLPKRMKTEKIEKLGALIYMKQLNMLYT